MAYGLSARLFLEDGPAIHAERARAARSKIAFRTWQAASEEQRLALVDRVLRAPANDLIDEFPVAL